MKQEEFIFWLQGFIDSNFEKDLSKKHIQKLKEKFNLVELDSLSKEYSFFVDLKDLLDNNDSLNKDDYDFIKSCVLIISEKDEDKKPQYGAC